MSIPQRFLKSGLSLSKITKRSFATYKTSTGLVGLAVAINGREDLLKLSSDVLESVKKIPDGTAYRGNVEKWFNFITKSCTDTHDIREIETEIGLGQIEEVMEMAKSELKLVDYYFEHRGWELVEEERRRADEVVAAMEDSIYFSTEMSNPTKPPEVPKP